MIRLGIVMMSFLLSVAGMLYVPKVGKSIRPDMTTLAVEDRDGYECRHVEFTVGRKSTDKERIRAYLLVPNGGTKCPAVLMLHDHGARFDIGKEKLVKPMETILEMGAEDHIMKSSRQWVDKNFDGVYLADSLASLGYVVMVADALYWGERSSEDAHRWSELTYGSTRKDQAVKDTIKVLKTRVYDAQETLYNELRSQDVIWAEKMLRDDVASVRLLKSLPFVDKDRIGAFGFSMGAHRCWMLAAFCKDVRCGVALSWMTTLDREERMKASDYSMAVMPMREQMDFGDIGRFLAPKPMLFMSGTTDHLFPKDKVSIAFEKLLSHYSDCPENLETMFFDGGHHCGKYVQSVIFDYLEKNLQAESPEMKNPAQTPVMTEPGSSYTRDIKS